MIYIGVDPGVGGGIAAIVKSGGILDTFKMPTTDRELLTILKRLERRSSVEGPAFGMLERVHSMPGQGHSGAFTFGKNVGALQMAMTAADIPFDLVSPIKWQNAMSCRTGGDKNVSKRRAEQLFPKWTITHAIADALLLAEYARRLDRQPVKSRRNRG